MGDFNVCPLVWPTVPPIPHVGGPVASGNPTNIVGGLPTAAMGDIIPEVLGPNAAASGDPTNLR